MPRKKKTFRNPNGYGTVYNIGGNRRKPWVAKISKGIVYDPELKRGYRQVYETLGYYESKDDAQFALMEYRKNPQKYDYDKSVENITFKDIYLRLNPQIMKDKSKKTIESYSHGYKSLSNLHDKKIKLLKYADYQEALDSIKLSYSSKSHAKFIIRAVCDYAEMNDIIDKNYSSLLKIGDRKKSNMHKPFTEKEINVLWENINKDYVDTILILIYTGLRVNAFLNIENSKIDIDNKFIVGGSKTDAGKDRVIPIHHKIMPLILNRYNKDEKYLIRNKRGGCISYDTYRKKHFDSIMEELGFNHLPHDTRHTFASRLDSAGVKETSISRLIGHTSFEMTDKNYIHKDLEELRKAIECL